MNGFDLSFEELAWAVFLAVFTAGALYLVVWFTSSYFKKRGYLYLLHDGGVLAIPVYWAQVNSGKSYDFAFMAPTPVTDQVLDGKVEWIPRGSTARKLSLPFCHWVGIAAPGEQYDAWWHEGKFIFSRTEIDLCEAEVRFQTCVV